MRINAINTSNYTNLKQNKQTNANTAFKGRSIGSIPIWAPGEWRHYPRPLIGYELPKGARPTRSDVVFDDKNGSSVYKADPFEIVPDKIYQEYDFIVRDDLPLSQIQKDYRNSSTEFSKNAEREIGFLEGLKNEKYEKIEFDTKRKEQYSERLKFANEVNADVAIKEALAKKINDYENGVKYHQNQITIIDKTLESAKQRYNLLKKLDDLVEKKDKLNRKYHEKFNPNDIETKEKLYFMGKEMDKLVEGEIKNLYEEKYPDWL